MTVIGGYWRGSGDGSAARGCELILKAQRFYASEDGRQSDAGEIVLGRALHRLLPEDLHDREPVVGGESHLRLVADVRLDNRQELAAALGLDDGGLRAMADSALLMHALEAWGEAAVPRLLGDFAFALWDRDRRTLTLARDFLGQRPLHYHRGRNFFAFASMPKGLHALPEVPYAPDRAAAADFLALIPERDHRSFFEGIEKVPAGHIVTVTAEGLTSRPYWQPDLSPLIMSIADDYVEALRERLDAAVAARLRGAEKEVAVQLSAGLDSASVAATAARLAAPGKGELWAFTAVPSAGHVPRERRDSFDDEGPLAAATASLYPNMHHVLVRTEGRSPIEDLDRHFFLYDRPILNPVNLVWADAIRDQAKARRLTVMLTGSMGNVGLSYSGMERLPELLRGGRWPSLVREAMGLRRFGLRYGTIASQTFGPFLPAGLWRLVTAMRGVGRRLTDYTLIDPVAVDSLGIAGRAAERGLDLSFRPRADPVGTRLWSLSRVDPGNYNKGVLGGWGIDQRDPTADRALIEFCLRVPAEQFLSDGVPRALVRRAMADRLPPEVLGERRKGLQAADWRLGFDQGRLREEIAHIADSGTAKAICDSDRMARLAAAWRADPLDAERENLYRVFLMRGVSAGHFLRKAARSNR